MKLPFLSPYLRPFVRNNQLVFDNMLTESSAPRSSLETSLLRALWSPSTAQEQFDHAARQHSRKTLVGAIQDLERDLFLFPDRAACEAALTARLSHRLDRLPFLDQIELTNHCPMQCGFCPRGIPGGMTRAKGFLSPNLFASILAQAHTKQSDYRWVELHHLGESLLHPELPVLLKLAHEASIPFELSCNPSLLLPKLSDELLRYGVKRIVASLDGLDEATLRHVRGPRASFSQAQENLRYLISQASKRNPPPQVVIQMLGLNANRHQRHDLLSIWGTQQPAFVEAYVKPVEGPDPDTQTMSAPTSDYLCTYPWRSVVVLWDGRVVPCCRDHDAQVVLGDLNDQSLEQIWTGPVATRLREQHTANDFPEGHPCASCSWQRHRYASGTHERHPDRASPEPLHW